MGAIGIGEGGYAWEELWYTKTETDVRVGHIRWQTYRVASKKTPISTLITTSLRVGQNLDNVVVVESVGLAATNSVA